MSDGVFPANLFLAAQFDLLALQHANAAARFRNQHREVAAAIELCWSRACKTQADQHRHEAYMTGEEQ